eukprot:GAHX01003651.1.p1 GENE.GAHX01003651.1~~GAHX01003651.1.p1  ORF type:complete len:230 (-),score=19.78 GAHX01003651.1:704-1393(-)
MPSQFALYSCFDSYVELIRCKNEYEENKNCKLSVHRSKRVREDNTNLVGTEYYKNRIKKRVVYEHVNLICETANRKLSQAKIKETTTKKTNCTAGVIIVLYKNKLKIVKSQLLHSECCYGKYSKSPIKDSVMRDVNLLIDNGTQTASVAEFLTQKTGEYYCAKDIHNIFLKHQTKYSIDQAVDILNSSGYVQCIHNTEKQLVGITYQTEQMKSDFIKYGNVVIMTVRSS